MNWHPSTVLLALAAPALAAAAAPAETTTVLELEFRTLRTFDIALPAETFVPIEGGIPFVGAPEGRFDCGITDNGLAFDRDADGTIDGEIAPTDEDAPTRLLTFRLDDGAAFAVRAKLDGRWVAAPGGAMMGALGRTPVAFIDQNGNGRFDDIGADAMVIGRSKVASFLSEIVELDGELFHLDVAPDGQRAELTPYTGPVGTLDLSGFESKAKLRGLVLNSADGKRSFELANDIVAGQATQLPAGTYRIHSGEVVKGKSSAQLTAGRIGDLVVAADGTTELAWGGPVQAEVAYVRRGNELSIAPEDVTYFGRAGEAYSNFMPLGSSPAFQVKDRVSGEVLVDMVFPGNC